MSNRIWIRNLHGPGIVQKTDLKSILSLKKYGCFGPECVLFLTSIISESNKKASRCSRRPAMERVSSPE